MSTPNHFPIEHVIVLMLENLSYDHMLGYLPDQVDYQEKRNRYVQEK